MKFWDTIAKMCGVKVDIRPASRCGESRGAFMCMTTEPWTMRVSAMGRTVALTASSEHGRAEVALNGHGLRVRDPESYVTSDERYGIRIGLIDVERVRPTVGKSGWVDIGAARAAAECLAQAAQKIAVEKPVVLS
jgi:hypothetical protein